MERYERAVAQAKTEGKVLLGGTRLTRGAQRQGALCFADDRAAAAREHALSHGALCAVAGDRRGLVVRRGDRGEQRTEYGLTAGHLTAASDEEVARFFDEIEAGVCYANKRTGATTGAWPGAQAFCGLEGLRLHRQGRLRAVLRHAVHARTEPHDHPRDR